MKAIPVFCLFILLSIGAFSQHPVTHAENPHEAAHQQAHQQAMQAHEHARTQAIEAAEQAHNQALEVHRKANKQALKDQQKAQKRAQRNLKSRSSETSNSGFMARWKERRMERAAARESGRQNQQ